MQLSTIMNTQSTPDNLNFLGGIDKSLSYWELEGNNRMQGNKAGKGIQVSCTLHFKGSKRQRCVDLYFEEGIKQQSRNI